jgi:hypothetical protein
MWTRQSTAVPLEELIEAMPKGATVRDLSNVAFALGVTLRIRLIDICPFLWDAWQRKAARERGCEVRR